MRYSLSSGDIKHVVVGDFTDLSLSLLKRLFQFGGHHDYNHCAHQISLGGQIVLRGWQCKDFLADETPLPKNTSRGDSSVYAAIMNSTETEFRLHVYEPHEEKVLLREALEDLETQKVALDAEFEKAIAHIADLTEKNRVRMGLVFNLQTKLGMAP